MQRSKVTILVYHNIPPTLFEQHIERLARVYNFISFNTYIEYREGRLAKLPSFPLIITFDDGYKENFELLPLFKRYGILPTIYLCTYPINTNRMVWSFYTENSKGIKVYLDTSYEEAKENATRLGFEVDKEFDNRTFLNFEEINEMRAWVDFQSHTANHANLAMASDETITQELVKSKEALEAIGLNVHTICYPFSYYSKTTIRQAKEIGYRYGVTVEPYFNSKTTHPFRIKRISINNTNPRLILVKASGLYAFIKEGITQRSSMRKYIDK